MLRWHSRAYEARHHCAAAEERAEGPRGNQLGDTRRSAREHGPVSICSLHELRRWLTLPLSCAAKIPRNPTPNIPRQLERSLDCPANRLAGATIPAAPRSVTPALLLRLRRKRVARYRTTSWRPSSVARCTDASRARLVAHDVGRAIALASGRREVTSLHSEPATFFSRAPWQSNARAKLRGSAAEKPDA